jgi:UDP-glucose 4-epimerase
MILVTGASGFLGRNLIDTFTFDVVTLGRTNLFKNDFFHRKEINSNENYEEALIGCDVVIHCAARVHVMHDSSTDALNEYNEVNTAGTLNLARQAANAGVKRFIFVSSVKVNGESTQLGKPFTEKDVRNPEDFYGKSKSEAEEQLLELANETGLEVVIIRPTLVYGPGVKANFASLLKLVSKGLPLPFGCIKHNKRSLVSVKNLVDLIITCIDHPKAANQVFLVSDDHDVSTASMVEHMSYALGKSSRLLPVPLWCYHLVGKLTDKSSVVDRLIGSLQVDISHTKDTLGWVPPQTLEDGFKETAEYFLLNKSK